MSESFLEDPYVILVLVGVYIILISLYFTQRHIGRKRYLFDERYYQTSNRAKAKSWDATLIILLIAWPIVIIFDGISFSFFLLTAIFVLHNMIMMISLMYYSDQT